MLRRQKFSGDFLGNGAMMVMMRTTTMRLT
jgi:hypothetical protein